uniref:Poly (ADP-ribose) polymerase family, member 12a n=1 Tax=Labrus bergylta TaxID=56723 RepID=A0A3Q3EWP9_9LABR
MSSDISGFIRKTLCDNRGCLDFTSLDEKIKQSHRVTDSALSKLLFDDDKICMKEGKQKVRGGQTISPDSLIVAKTSLRLCQKKPGECPQCDGLHLCRYYVSGGCTYGQKCKNGHSLVLPQNAELLMRHGLQDLTEKQLFQLLLQNDPYLLPEICPHYNKGNGLHGSCKYALSCNKLHICQHYFQGDCRFGSSCKRVHNIGECSTKILRGLSPENITNLNEIYRNKYIIVAQQERQAVTVSNKPVSEADRNEICLYFIRRDCRYKETCARVHFRLPYRWQVLDGDGVTWKDLPDMEDMEKAYCDPGCDSSYQAVDFQTMTCGGSPVRRLSTASSVSKPPHFILTTQWLWYWKDDIGEWQEYGQDEADTSASVTSKTLENVYLADRDKEIQFQAGKQKYILCLKGAAGTLQMYQQNVKYKTKREVRRRPRFVSAQEVEEKLKSPSSHSSSSSTPETFPPHWSKNALPDLGYTHNMMRKLFKLTMPNSTIHSIQRIQNPSLWRVFQWQKEQMKKRNGGKLVNEQYLFHGTDESLIEPICDQNFDWRMCGVHGTSYGKGSYFAKDTNKKSMFVALVLVGEYTRGSSSYVRPPPKGDGKTLYDSCVDRESNPSIHVVFEKQQIYPEYLISYS